MKALTIWQPWASLIIGDAKPFEFRSWPAPRWIVGKDIVIHAGSRPMRVDEVEDLIERLSDERTRWTTGLFRDAAMPILKQALEQAKAKRPRVAALKPDLFGALPSVTGAPPVEHLPIAAGLGIVRVGPSVNGNDTAQVFGHVVNDSDREQHANWGWSMLNIRPFAEPIPMKGAQGFWTWPEPAEWLA